MESYTYKTQTWILADWKTIQPYHTYVVPYVLLRTAFLIPKKSKKFTKTETTWRTQSVF